LSRITPRGRLALLWLPAVLALVLAGCSASASNNEVAGRSSTPTPESVAPTTVVPTQASISDSQLQLVANRAMALQKGTGPYGVLVRTGSDGVALTFDDGPDATYTPQFLDLLKQTGVKATFCVVGKRAVLYPDLLRRIVAEGHTLCNHSYYHDLGLGKLTVPAMTKDLQDTLDVIHGAVPGYKVRYFRAPGGNFTQALVNAAASLGMRSLSWAVDPRDWDFTNYGHGQSMVNHIMTVVEGQARPGVVILSHDLSKPDTIAAYRLLIRWLKARFTLVTMPDF
jgi:peptidoglycan-N-acetylglucosamine deacetylase